MGIGRARRVVAGTVLVAMTLLGTALAPAGAAAGSSWPIIQTAALGQPLASAARPAYRDHR